MNDQLRTRDIPPVFQEILKSRRVEGDEGISSFLFPRLEDLPLPTAMKGMAEAVELVAEYLIEEKPIVVWGDYDVDGTTGTALLVNFFKIFGRDVDWHIPNRLTEGYGLNFEWFDRYYQKKIGNQGFLLITVDCGISEADEIDKINGIGGRVIVTDHHSLPAQPLPDCIVLNPSQESCGFHNHHLAGVGVAFYLAAGLRAKLTSNPVLSKKAKTVNLKQFLGFVALGTIADLVYLSPTNRILVRGGFETFKITIFIGIAALLDSCDIKNGDISSEDIGFLIGPLINAAGRVGDSATVVQLLTSTSPEEATKLVKKLVKLNIKRKAICIENFEDLICLLNETQVSDDRCIVAAGDIHQGVAGIVASRLVDRFRVPTVVLGKKQDKSGACFLVGSARSVEGVSIVKAIGLCSEFVVKFGGHDMAAGVTLLEANYSGFQEKLKTILAGMMTAKPVLRSRVNDFSCSVGDLMSREYLDFLQLFEPFGPGNEAPVFIDKNTRIIDSKRVGKGAEHLQVAIRGKYANYKGIGFGLGKQRDEIQQNPNRNLRYTPTKNRFRGTTSWQVRIIDL